MSRWFRHYAGMMRDDKLVRVAIRSGQSIERVVWIWGAILESAAEIDDNGRYDLDAAEIAYFLRADVDDVGRILSELQAAGRCAEGCVAKWGDRQFTSDRSAVRQRAHRERRRHADSKSETVTDEVCDATVTSPSRHRDAPETETETETKTEETPIVPLAGGRRGKTLIPADWKAPSVSELPPRSRACAEQWTEASYQTEAEGFLLYWQSERKMKSDWRGTWANRIIARHSAVMRDQKFGNAPPELPKYVASRDPAEAHEWWLGQAEFFRKIDREDDALRCEANAKALEEVNPELANKIVELVSDAADALRVSKVRAA
jgi:hypothetical protein